MDGTPLAGTALTDRLKKRNPSESGKGREYTWKHAEHTATGGEPEECQALRTADAGASTGNTRHVLNYGHRLNDDTEDDTEGDYDQVAEDSKQVFVTIPGDGGSPSCVGEIGDTDATVRGIVTRLVPSAAAVEADPTATPPTKAVPARDGVLEYKLFQLTSGYSVDDKGCYAIEGGGSLQIDVEKSEGSGVCIDGPTIDGGGVVENIGGQLIFKKATTIDGDFINSGLARTEFWGETTVNGTLEIEGGTGANSANRLIGPVLTRTGASDHVALQGSRTAGVVAYNVLTIAGDLDLRNSNVKAADAEGDDWDTGLVLSGDVEPAKRVNDDATEDDKKASGITSTVFGSVLLRDSSYVRLGDHDRYHNLAVEGHVSVSTDSKFGQSDNSTTYQTAETEDNICKGHTDSVPTGEYFSANWKF